MENCKDCIHSEICASHLKAVRGIYGAVMSISGREVNHLKSALSEISIIIGQICYDDCDRFQNRSRFVELPVKPGTVLFVPIRNQITKYKITGICVREHGFGSEMVLIEGISCSPFYSDISAIGKTAFLTHEAAEQSLKEREAT